MQVVTCLALAQIAVLGFLWSRNRYFDRVNALLHVPFVVQEVLQAALWFHIDEKSEPKACSKPNHVLSYVLALLVSGTPCWIWLITRLQRLALFPLPANMQAPSWLAFARRQLGLLSSDLEWPRRTLSKDLDREASEAACACWTFMLGSAFYFTIRFFTEPSGPPWLVTFIGGPTCTTRGPYGHQVWPLVVYSHWSMMPLLAVIYAGVSESFNLLPRPSFAFSFLRLSKLPAMLFFFLLGNEWGAVWSGLTSCLCLLYMGEPILFHLCHVLDPLALIEDPSSQEVRREAGTGFYIAWKHVPMDMAPWLPNETGKGHANVAKMPGYPVLRPMSIPPSREQVMP